MLLPGQGTTIHTPELSQTDTQGDETQTLSLGHTCGHTQTQTDKLRHTDKGDVSRHTARPSATPMRQLLPTPEEPTPFTSLSPWSGA